MCQVGIDIIILRESGFRSVSDFQNIICENMIATLLKQKDQKKGEIVRLILGPCWAFINGGFQAFF